MPKKGKVILVGPQNAWTRRWRVARATMGTMWEIWRGAETRRESATVMRSGQSLGRKVERLKAHMAVESATAVHSERTIERLGLRKQRCTCRPGRGHNEPRKQGRR